MNSSTTIRFEPPKREAPPGQFLVRITGVNPSWTMFEGMQKVCVYAEVADGPHRGAVARRFYRLKPDRNGAFCIGRRSNLAKDARDLFGVSIDEAELDPVALFTGKFFEAVIERKPTKDGSEQHAIITELRKHDPGF